MIPTYGTPGCEHPDKRKFGNGIFWCTDCGAVYDGVAWDMPAVLRRHRGQLKYLENKIDKLRELGARIVGG